VKLEVEEDKVSELHSFVKQEGIGFRGYIDEDGGGEGSQ